MRHENLRTQTFANKEQAEILNAGLFKKKKFIHSCELVLLSYNPVQISQKYKYKQCISFTLYHQTHWRH